MSWILHLSPSYNLTSDDFDRGLWPLTTWKYKGSHIVSIKQVWFQSDIFFKWGHYYIFSLSYNLTSDDLWPWYMTIDLINKWGYPCCIYEPTLVEIHQSMWKVESNFYPILTTADINNNRGQSDLYVSFRLRQATQKQKSSSCPLWPWIDIILGNLNLQRSFGAAY